MKALFIVPSVLLLSLPNAWAAESDSLTAGKPAGLHQAQLEGGNGMFVVAGAALIGITVALATASNDASQPTGTSPVTSTTTTGTSP